jgi:hypothetical protein
MSNTSELPTPCINEPQTTPSKEEEEEKPCSTKVDELLEFFSELTQTTLSAFHKGGTTTELNDDIADLKRFITHAKYKQIARIDPVPTSVNQVTLVFTDGSTKVVDQSENMISHKHEYEHNPQFDIIKTALEQEMSPITALKLSKEIKLVDHAPIKRASERIFFGTF